MAVYIVLTIFFVWLVVLTSIVFKTKEHYNSLISNTRKRKIDEILDELLLIDKKTKEELLKLGNEALESMNVHVVIANDLFQISNQQHPALILDRNNSMLQVNSKEEIIKTIIQKLEHAL